MIKELRPGSGSPGEIVRDTLARLDTIKDILVITVDKDEIAVMSMSVEKISTLCFMAASLNASVDDHLNANRKKK